MSGTKQKIFAIVIFVLVVLFGVGQFFAGANLTPPAQNPNNPPATQVIVWAPPLPASSTPVLKGSCFASSVAAPYRADAWRCMVGNAISDPCFQVQEPVAASNTLPIVCGANPVGNNTSSTFVIALTKPLPKQEIPSSTPSNWAWLVELGDGTVCSPFTGTRPFAKTGEVATYSCRSGASIPTGALIFGDLNNASATWTAEVGVLSTATSTFPPAMIASATVPVFTVWQ